MGFTFGENGWTFRGVCRHTAVMFHFFQAAGILRCVAFAFLVVCGALLPVSPAAENAAAWQRAAHVDASQSGDVASGDTGEIEAAWDRAGCPLNPSNPTCVLLGRASACDISDRDPGCTSDSDNDGCQDISEVLAGLDPGSGDDCLGDAAGTPLLNCLFLQGNASCNAGNDQTTPLDCPLLSRDPTCDGFAR